jgi:hypothetical protein
MLDCAFGASGSPAPKAQSNSFHLHNAEETPDGKRLG